MTSNIIPRLSISVFEFGGMQLPFGGLTNAESDFHALAFERVIGCQGAADALIQHSQTVVRERRIIHRACP
jgi:hypothetical protein